MRPLGPLALPRSIVVAGWLCALFSALSVWLRSFDPSAFNHDVAYVLYVAGQLLDGRALYVDIVEVKSVVAIRPKPAFRPIPANL